MAFNTLCQHLSQFSLLFPVRLFAAQRVCALEHLFSFFLHVNIVINFLLLCIRLRYIWRSYNLTT